MIDLKSTLKQVYINFKVYMSKLCFCMLSQSACDDKSQRLQPQAQRDIHEEPTQTNTHSCTERSSTNTGTHRSSSAAKAPEEPVVPEREAVVSASKC